MRSHTFRPCSCKRSYSPQGESLAFLWSEPENLRIFVRGASVGEVCAPKLARGMHESYLREKDPRSPAAKEGVHRGAMGLFS